MGSTTWQYAPGASGTLTFSTSSLSGVGRWTAWYLYSNAYQPLATSVSFTVVPSQPAPAPVFQRAIHGTGRGALSGPSGVAAAPDGDIWVADAGHDRVSEFARSGELVTTFRETGAAALSRPAGVAVDAGHHVWVADTGHDRVVEFSSSGAEMASFGRAGSGPGQLDKPAGLAVASSGHVYVADQGNSRVEEFSAAGAYLASLSVATPGGVALDASGNVWVSSPSYADGNAIYEFSPSGAKLRQFGSTQAGYGALSNPEGIAVGPSGRIYVAQPDYGWVTVYNPDGSFYTEFGLQPGTSKTAENLAFPQGVAAGSGDHVWVADTGHNRIAEFAAAGGPSGAAAVVPPAAGPFTPWWAVALLAAAVIGLGTVALVALRRRRRGLSGPGQSPLPRVPALPALPGISARGKRPEPEPAPVGPALTRRGLLSGATLLTGAGLGAAMLPPNLRKALASAPDGPPRGKLGDIQNIVILMQENRSFDHYFGTMPGVRGFSDPRAIKLPNGKPVFYQPDPAHTDGYLLPFHYDTRTTSAQATPGTDHSWPTQHQAWNGGKLDSWVPAKGEFTMGYFDRDDIPFHWALAEAFTICDSYHCSVLGPTNPNRLHMFTGMLDPNGTGGGPIIDNSPAFNNAFLSWTTYPERLQRAGISWQVYQEEDNYDDNSLAWFKQYANAPTSSPLYQRGMLEKPAGWFEDDARNDRLPQVSWLVAPSAQTEHPDYFPAAGAEYIAQKLDAIAANPDVWAKTAFILCYDENDGMFDHVPPPTAPAGTAGEIVQGEPIGLGFRVPAIVVSPWTAGGYVCSDVLDHTSLIRFVEARFGVREPNISAWRRQTCGDFTSAFRFASRPAAYPRANLRLRLAAAEAELLTAQQEVNDNPAPTVPAVNQPLPGQ